MTPLQFCFWLQGYIDARKPTDGRNFDLSGQSVCDIMAKLKDQIEPPTDHPVGALEIGKIFDMNGGVKKI